MRTKQEIIESIQYSPQGNYETIDDSRARNANSIQRGLVEVLIDIRDLLSQEKPENTKEI